MSLYKDSLQQEGRLNMYWLAMSCLLQILGTNVVLRKAEEKITKLQQTNKYHCLHVL